MVTAKFRQSSAQGGDDKNPAREEKSAMPARQEQYPSISIPSWDRLAGMWIRYSPDTMRAGVELYIMRTAQRTRREKNPDEDEGTWSHEWFEDVRKYPEHRVV